MPNESANSGASSRLDELIAEYLLAAEGGAQPNLEKMIAENPAEASGLRAFHDDWQAAKNYFPPTAAFVPAQPATTSPRPTTSHAESVHSTIAGKYKLLQEIGEGGMGTVFMAQQTSDLKRLVAVKLIRRDLTAAKLLARFEAERQALALMDHPNIAKVFDAGTTDSGRPFYVMELVKGLPLLRYCDERRLSIPDRLALFAQICQGVQHAHQKGIIHRDLKPSNILVEEHDGKPVPKIIDFGLAKSTTMQLTDKTLFTDFGMVLGTYLYMAPEQAVFNALDIDTRADVYALGVILYELLTGSTPIERAQLQAIALDEVLRTIREVEAPKPSDRLSKSGSLPSVAATRNIEPAQLSRMMRGDLDWIVMKALEKERGRRYDTPAALAEDLARFRELKPVLAGPPSTVYRFRKFVRRNRVMLFFATIVIALIVAGAAAAIVQELRRAQIAEKVAGAERAAAVADAKRAEIARENDKLAYEKQLETERAEAVGKAAEYVQLLTNIRERKERLEPGWTKSGWEDLKKAVSLKTPLRNSAELRSTAATLLTNPDVSSEPDWEFEFAQSRQPTDIAYSPSGKLVAAALSGSVLAQHPTTLVIDAETGKLKYELVAKDSFLSIGPNTNYATSVCFGGDDKIVFMGTRRGKIHRWNLASDPIESFSIQAATDAGVVVSVTPNNKYVISNVHKIDTTDLVNRFPDTRIRCWNSESLELVAETTPRKTIFTRAFISPSSDRLVAIEAAIPGVAVPDVKLVQFGLPSLTHERDIPLWGQVAFNRHGNRFATNHGGKLTIRAIDTLETAMLFQSQGENTDPQTPERISFANGGETLAALSNSTNSVALLRPSRPRPWSEIKLPRNEVLTLFAMSESGRRLALCSDHKVAQFSIRTESPVHSVWPQESAVWGIGVPAVDSEFSANLQPNRFVRRSTNPPNQMIGESLPDGRLPISYSPDKRWMVTGRSLGMAINGIMLTVLDSHRLPSAKGFIVEYERSPKFRPDLFVGCGWTSQGYFVAALHNRLMVWDPACETPQLICSNKSEDASWTYNKIVAFNFFRDEAITVDEKRFVARRRFDGKQFVQITRFLARVTAEPTTCAQFEADGLLAIGCTNGEVAITELKSGNVIASNTSVHHEHIVTMLWPNRDRLITGSRNGLVAVWRVGHGRLELEYQFHTIAKIRQLAAPADGNRIYCCQEGDDCVDVFDLKVLEEKFAELGIQSPRETHEE